MIQRWIQQIIPNYGKKIVFTGLAIFSTASVLSASAPSAASSASAGDGFSTSKGFLQPRASSANIAREMLMEPGAQQPSSGSWYGEFSATGFYQRYWSPNNEMNELGALPFWSGTNLMSIGNNTQASTTAPIVLANVDAYQFGMGPVNPGQNPASIKLDPIVYQAGTDFMFIIGASAIESSFYTKAKVALAVYNITYQLTENNPVTAIPYPAGALDDSGSAVADPATTMSQAFTGFKHEQLTGDGDFTPMVFGLINDVTTTVIKFGDVEVTAGYNFITQNNDSFTIAARMSFPTGNKASGVYMLEPIVGRGGNYGLGAYTAGNVCLWEGNDDDKLTFRFMGEAMHLFTTSTMRSYDLKSAGQGSRYLLVANYLNGSYQDDIQNLINHTTLLSNSTFGAEGDIAVGFNYAYRGWVFDLGYEFYGRSAETLEIIPGEFLDQTYAILGRQGVASSVDGTTPTTLCQPSATIGSSVDRQNISGVPSALVVDATIATNRIALSDLDRFAAQQKEYLTSKLFTKIAFEWEDVDNLPFIGLIGEFEYSNSSNNSLPQWSLVLVGGVSF